MLGDGGRSSVLKCISGSDICDRSIKLNYTCTKTAISIFVWDNAVVVCDYRLGRLEFGDYSAVESTET